MSNNIGRRGRKYPSVAKAPSKAKIAIKSCIAVFLAGIILVTVIGLVENIRFSYEYGSNRPDRVLEMLDTSYYDQEYGKLLNSLRMYEAYGEEHDKYWEVVDTYEQYLKYKDMVGVPGYETDAEKQFGVLEDAVNNCRNSDNTKRLQKMLTEAEALRTSMSEAAI